MKQTLDNLAPYEKEYPLVGRVDGTGLSVAVARLTFGRARLIRYRGLSILDGY